MKASVVIFLLLLLLSCRKDDENSVLFQTWEVKDFMSIESVAYPKNENTKILLTFTKSGSYNLKLDINSCGGRFSTSGKSGLSIESAACTEACCDSPFSNKLAGMLSKVKSYEIDQTSLRLEVPQWGYIECKTFSSGLINPNP